MPLTIFLDTTPQGWIAQHLLAFPARPTPSLYRWNAPVPLDGAIHRCRVCPTAVPSVLRGPSHTGRTARIRVYGWPVYSWKLADSGPLSIASIAVATGISQRESPQYVLVEPWPWRGSMSGANLRNPNATPDTYLTRPDQNTLRAALDSIRSCRSVPPVATPLLYKISANSGCHCEQKKTRRSGLARHGTILIFPSGARNFVPEGSA